MIPTGIFVYQVISFPHLSEVIEISPAVEDPGYAIQNFPHPSRDARKLNTKLRGCLNNTAITTLRVFLTADEHNGSEADMDGAKHSQMNADK